MKTALIAAKTGFTETETLSRAFPETKASSEPLEVVMEPLQPASLSELGACMSQSSHLHHQLKAQLSSSSLLWTLAVMKQNQQAWKPLAVTKQVAEQMTVSKTRTEVSAPACSISPQPGVSTPAGPVSVSTGGSEEPVQPSVSAEGSDKLLQPSSVPTGGSKEPL